MKIDDLMVSDCVEKMVAVAEANPTVGLVYCPREILLSEDVDTNELWLKTCRVLHDKWKNIDCNGFFVGKKIFKDPFFFKSPRNKIGEPSAVLLTKRYMDIVGKFSYALKQELDYEYWYRLLKYSDAYFINEHLVSFRRHAEQTTEVNAKNNYEKKLERIRLNFILLVNFFMLFSSYNRKKVVVEIFKVSKSIIKFLLSKIKQKLLRSTK